MTMTERQPYYFGRISTGFWADVANIKDKSMHDLVYVAACALQDHEKRVLQMMRMANADGEGEGEGEGGNTTEGK